MDWYEITEEQRSKEQNEACRRAYFRFLLNSKEVYADMLRRARESDTKREGEVSAGAVLHLDEFMRKTRVLCGPMDVMAVLRAESRAAGVGVVIEETIVEQMDGIAVDA